MDPFNVVKAVCTSSRGTSRARPEQLKMSQVAFEHHLSQAAQERSSKADAELFRHAAFAQHEAGIGMVSHQPDEKLVFVSNRVSTIDPNKPKTGGLAAVLEPVVERSGAVWMGSSGTLSEGREQLNVPEPHGRGEVVKVDLPAAHYDNFYYGFANSTLWPAFHSLTERMSPASEEHYKSYCEINRAMARALSRLKNRGAIWVHDYHFLPLGNELRERSIQQPIGFFLHTPWPKPDVMEQVPHHRELMEAMLAYDLVGFQTRWDLDNFLSCLRTHLGLESKSDFVISDRGLTRCQTFPIGIDPKQFEEYAVESLATHRNEISSMQNKLDGTKLAIGVDRLDYTKGIDNRIKALDQVLADKPHSTSLLQIGTSSRADIPAYGEYQRDIDSLVSDVNRRHRTDDGWKPILYEKGHFPQMELAGLYRTADVGLVTPLRDGMNLVAKEYVAAQDSNDPGVLVLSKFAGAAEELNENEALHVDPASPRDIATAISTATDMPQEERIERWRAMMNKLEAYTIHDWSKDFLRELGHSRVAMPADQFRYLGFGWINEAQMPTYATQEELNVAVKQVQDPRWIFPS
ncbi:trehalose-6-phosphate synthase [Bradyrhizobium sp. CB82]|uniref:alpha,alpha-trehalose-phosphate synthase (UDP-forming) n=1 Tax=Bradyrhizobium sp. CB82 TaxID=3039159 RepID=UPI0024B17CF6|nr:trehalose-6-phosphate synthase [Bradyrhizobium sp. CB82]WFU40255.1 trehalose-6-phosphate synthase [Bradyrhizobium sp. CB82]